MSSQADWIAKLRYTLASPECDPNTDSSVILSPSVKIADTTMIPIPSLVNPIVGFIQEASTTITGSAVLCSTTVTTVEEKPIVIWGLVDVAATIGLQLTLNGTVVSSTTASNFIFTSTVAQPPGTYTIALTGTGSATIHSSRILALG